MLSMLIQMTSQSNDIANNSGCHHITNCIYKCKSIYFDCHLKMITIRLDKWIIHLNILTSIIISDIQTEAKAATLQTLLTESENQGHDMYNE